MRGKDTISAGPLLHNNSRSYLRRGYHHQFWCNGVVPFYHDREPEREPSTRRRGDHIIRAVIHDELAVMFTRFLDEGPPEG